MRFFNMWIIRYWKYKALLQNAEYYESENRKNLDYGRDMYARACQLTAENKVLNERLTATKSKLYMMIDRNFERKTL